jgi:hypothetical protein
MDSIVKQNPSISIPALSTRLLAPTLHAKTTKNLTSIFLTSSPRSHINVQGNTITFILHFQQLFLMKIYSLRAIVSWYLNINFSESIISNSNYQRVNPSKLNGNYNTTLNSSIMSRIMNPIHKMRMKQRRNKKDR